MKLLEHSKNETSYKIRIWLDETKFDPQGNPYPEWVLERTWGLSVPMNEIADGEDEQGNPKTKQEPAMTQKDYEAAQLNEAIAQAKEALASLANNSQQVTAPKEL